MKKTNFTEQQIAFALRQAETGTRVIEVCRKLGISDATFYNWKKKHGGLGAGVTALEATGRGEPVTECVTGCLPGKYPAGCEIIEVPL